MSRSKAGDLLNRLWPLLGLLVVYAATRALNHRLGLRLSYDQMAGLWQVIDLAELRDHLARSLWYLHIQPPLFNALNGAILKLAPERAAATALAQAVFLALGYSQLVALQLLLERLRFGRRAAFAMVAFFAVSPAPMFFEAWWFYDHLVAVTITWLVLALACYVDRPTAAKGLAFFGLLALLVLLRSAYHLVYAVIVTAAVMVLAARGTRRRILMHAAVPLLLCVGWYAKNAVLFGQFGSSTWTGFGLYRTMFIMLNPAGIEAEIQAGAATPMMRIYPFSPAEAYDRFLPPDIPIHDARVTSARVTSQATPNFNWEPYIWISSQYARDSAAMIRRHPALYARAVVRGILISFHPSTDLYAFKFMPAPCREYERLYSMTLLGQIKRDDGARVWMRCAWTLVAGYAIVLAIAAMRLAAGIRGRERLAADDTVLLFVAGTIVYTLLVGAMMEHGENNRFRFPLDGATFAMAACCVRSLVATIKGRIG